ncbi:hypothetical protein CTI12_AA425370 [Artemisia annua]|uniref:Uncharacterized protein n=1 Tax=Artemisia annua TaxID=35608 RepID=A0A2U1M3P6_ARTAN|nr:hypothetical protein CTI12_AA425370 [Artemisia annua]
MSLSSTFKDLIQQMEHTTNQRLSLLQAEKELQVTKSKTVASKLSDIRYIEQKCFNLQHKIASQHFVISSIKSQLDRLESSYLEQIQQFRALKSEVENLEELDKEKDKYYALKRRDIDEFRAKADTLLTDYQKRVEELRSCVNELNSSYIGLQRSGGYSDNGDLAAAEMRKCELEAVKQSLDRKLVHNYETKAQLEKQLKSILISQKEQKKPYTSA